MARIVFLALCYLLFAPVAWVALSWWLIAYRADPNYVVWVGLMGFVLLAPIAFVLKKWRGERVQNAQKP